MKFIVDAQLPRKLASWITTQGYNAIHTLYLPAQNLTEDNYIIKLSMQEFRIVISKDSDFYDSFVLKGEPYKLLIVSTGNITNKDLIVRFEQNFEKITELLKNKAHGGF